jgi:putative DNA methylase
MTPYRKKLIEVALPLEAINVASAREKAIRHGHPSTLHLWWARRPLAACRAVLFGQLVDDPSSWPSLWPTEEAQEVERQRLFRLIEHLVLWENSNNETVINDARREIAVSLARGRQADGIADPRDDAVLVKDPKPVDVNRFLAEVAPPVHDPFAGGGSIPLEAQRLGLRAIATDLNPVAVLINKALIEIPPKFAGMPAVNPESRRLRRQDWKGAQGLAEDVRYYGRWMRDEALRRIGHLYPQVDLPKEKGGQANVIAWIWARTVASPDPALGGAHVPLISSYWLGKKPGKEAWLEPVIDRASNTGASKYATGSPRIRRPSRRVRRPDAATSSACSRVSQFLRRIFENKASWVV